MGNKATQLERRCVNEVIKWNNNAKKWKRMNSKIIGCHSNWNVQPPPITHDEKCMKSMFETKNYVMITKILNPMLKRKKENLIKDIMRKRDLGLYWHQVQLAYH